MVGTVDKLRFMLQEKNIRMKYLIERFLDDYRIYFQTASDDNTPPPKPPREILSLSAQIEMLDRIIDDITESR